MKTSISAQNAPQNPQNTQNPQLVELTSKKWKALKAWGVLGMAAGLVLFLCGAFWVSMALLIGGVGTVFYAGIGAWWYHG